MRARVASFLQRHKRWLFGAWLLHAVVIHYVWIGYLSWDGFAYRVTPIVELMQRGSLGLDKFNDWTMVGYTPFIELLHIPFLKLLGLRGLLLGYPLVAFPLCTAAVYVLIREVTGSGRAATFGALAYVAIPMVNQQPFTGYVDFAVAGALAFWLYAMARLRAEERPLVRYGRLALATFVMTMSRSQGVFIVIVLTPILAYAMFGTWHRWRPRFGERGLLARTAIVLALSSVPAIGLQIYKYYAFGSPFAPMQFQLLGISIGHGVPIAEYFRHAGLAGTDLGSLATGFFEGWIWHAGWPIGAFFASRFMAAGLLFILALCLVPVFLRHSTRLERWIVVGGILVSVLSRDLAVPRWSYTTVISMALVIGRSLAVLAEAKRGAMAFWLALFIVLAHLARPEIDVLQIQAGYISHRMNVTRSSHFIHTNGVDEIEIYPNRALELVIIETTPFTLQLYGQTMTNQILGTILGPDVGARCEGLREVLTAHPHALFVDDQHFSRNCVRECIIPMPNAYCAAWAITLPGP